MKRSGLNHPKVKRLARRIKAPLWAARGLMESIWHATAVHHPRGDIGKWSNESIADAVDWDDDPDDLITALIGAGLLDECPVHRLVVHD